MDTQKNQQLVQQLEDQIADLKEYDEKLKEVAELLLDEIIRSRRNKQDSYKSLTRNPEYLNAISSMAKARADVKKSIIKAILDEANLINKIGEYKDDNKVDFDALATLVNKALRKEDNHNVSSD